jgi:hypothetical protein
MSRLTGALIAVAAILAGAAMAVLVAGSEGRTVTQATSLAASLVAVTIGGVVIRQRKGTGRHGRRVAIAALVLGITGLAVWLVANIGDAGSSNT